MAMSAEQMSKYAALRLWWWRLHMTEKLSSGTKKKNKKQNNNKTQKNKNKKGNSSLFLKYHEWEILSDLSNVLKDFSEVTTINSCMVYATYPLHTNTSLPR